MIKIGLVLIALGLAALAAFRIIGSSLDGNGTLHEAFGLLPVGYLLLFLGLLLGLLAFGRSFIKKRRIQTGKDAN